ncbi:hypothetical protein GCM10027059_36420 [Myceligenerans halotolerans]
MYADDLKDDHFETYLAGNPYDPNQIPGFTDWLDHIRALTAEGRRMERVRIQQDPPTDYQRYARWVGRWNEEAGEVMHYTTPERARTVGLLPEAGEDDWWLLDDARLIVMEFDTAGELIGLRLETDEASLERARALRRLALRAVPS